MAEENSLIEKQIQKEKEKEKQYSLDVQDTIKKAEDLVKDSGNVKHAAQLLFDVERKVRNAQQGENTTNVILAIIRICADSEEWDLLNEYIPVISKKRNQINLAVTEMVNLAMKYIDKTPSIQERTRLITTLREVSEGKIHIELQRAELIKMLVEIKVDEGKMEEAVKLVQEVQVETIGSMKTTEKIEFILYQMNLCMNTDISRAYILSKKITPRTLSFEGRENLKIQYYQYLSRYYKIKNNFLELCKCYYNIFEALESKAEETEKAFEEKLEVTGSICIFICLSKYDNHQSDLIHRAAKIKYLEEEDVVLYKQLIESFISDEVVDVKQFEAHFGKLPISVEEREILVENIVEKNIRVISKYYSRIRISRLASIISQNENDTESIIAKMVESKTLNAKIDRIDGIVNFAKQIDRTEKLNNWNSDINKLLSLLEKTNHLINKEIMIQKPV